MNSQEENEQALRPQPLEGSESPFLDEKLFVGEVETEWKAHLSALEAESPFRYAFEQGQAMPFELEELEEEFVEQEEWTEAEDFLLAEAEDYDDEALADLEENIEEYDEDEFDGDESYDDEFDDEDRELLYVEREGVDFSNEDLFLAEMEEELSEQKEWAEVDNYTFHQDDLDDRSALKDFASESPAATLEPEAADYTSDHELLDFKDQLMNSEIWQDTADQIAFRDRVLNAHIAQRRKRYGAAKRDLSDEELRNVPGTSIRMRPDAAVAAGRLLAAANADLAEAKTTGHADALLTIRLDANSGYRGSAEQRLLWIRYFGGKNGYYSRTQKARERLAGGPHSEEAVKYMLFPTGKGGFGLGGRIAAPGYSNHQSGIAIDFKQVRKRDHEIMNRSFQSARAKWRSTWFHDWLKANAARFGFEPLPTEEWHWNYRGGASTTAPSRTGDSSSAGSAGLLPTWLSERVKSGRLTLQAAWAMLSGQRDVNTLTNMIFYAHHPDLPVGYKIKPHEKQLAESWVRIRDNVVKPMLRRLAAGVPTGSYPRTALVDDMKRGTSSLGMGKPAVAVPGEPNAYRKFRLTTYYVVDQNDHPTSTVRVPIYDESRRKIAEVSPAFFAKLSLEGTGLLNDGRLINVAGKRKIVSVSHDDYAEVLAHHNRAYAKRNARRREERRKPIPTSYSGIFVENGRVVRAKAFYVVPAAERGEGYGRQRGNIPMIPFRTLAADTGTMQRHEKEWKDKGGIVPVGTYVYIKGYDGLRLPRYDGAGYFTHDGWFRVNDTGGAIYGAHFDVFVGTSALRKQVKLPEFSQVWFAGIEQRIPPGYTYGLKA